MATIKYNYHSEEGDFRLIYKDGIQYREYEDGRLEEAPRMYVPERFRWRMHRWLKRGH